MYYDVGRISFSLAICGKVQSPAEITRALGIRPDYTHLLGDEIVSAGGKAVVDCADRSVVGYCVSKRCRAEEAVWALEDACLKRFGALPRGDAGVTVRSDNGLVFASRLYRRLLRSYGLQQEFIHPHTPEQNGVVEAYHKTFKRKCVWQNRFATIEEATTVIAAWIDRYNNERPHSRLGYLTPADWRDRDAARLTTLTV